MRFRPWPLAGSYSPETTCDGEAESFEHDCEEAVLLEAVATAFLVDELADQRVDVEMNASAEEYIDVLERDGGDVGAVDGLEGDVSAV